MKFINALESKNYLLRLGFELLFFGCPAFGLGTIPAALSHLDKMLLYYIEIGHDSFLNNISISPRVIPSYRCALCNFYTKYGVTECCSKVSKLLVCEAPGSNLGSATGCSE